MKEARLRGLYEYTMLLRVPEKPGIHVPYRLLAELASTAPENALEDYVVKRLATYGMVKEGPTPELLKKIRWAAAWAKRPGAVAAVESLPELSEKHAKVIREFATAVKGAKSADEVQGAAFNVIRASGLQPGEFFPLVYEILLGAEKGPRLGPYIMDAGPKSVAEKLLKAIAAAGKHN
jgi:lysyl-tRNA synthetase class 1